MRVAESPPLKEESMLNLLFATLALTTLGGSAQAKPLALKGFDPVLLVDGKQVKGVEANSAEFGNFKYFFASNENKAMFTKEPSRYAVQNNGDCGLMPR